MLFYGGNPCMKTGLKKIYKLIPKHLGKQQALRKQNVMVNGCKSDFKFKILKKKKSTNPNDPSQVIQRINCTLSLVGYKLID